MDHVPYAIDIDGLATVPKTRVRPPLSLESFTDAGMVPLPKSLWLGPPDEAPLRRSLSKPPLIDGLALVSHQHRIFLQG